MKNVHTKIFKSVNLAILKMFGGLMALALSKKWVNKHVLLKMLFDIFTKSSLCKIQALNWTSSKGSQQDYQHGKWGSPHCKNIKTCFHSISYIWVYFIWKQNKGINLLHIIIIIGRKIAVYSWQGFHARYTIGVFITLGNF